MHTAISVENLSYTYPGVEDTPGVTVFTDLDLTIEAGSFVAVLCSGAWWQRMRKIHSCQAF